jgi:enoyl-CoA hydratase/carnithine racemase
VASRAGGCYRRRPPAVRGGSRCTSRLGSLGIAARTESRLAPTVRLAVDADTGVGTVHLDRPPLNALDVATWVGLGEVVAAADRDPKVRALVVWGGTRAFAAGADVTEFPAWGRAEAAASAATFHRTLDALAALPMVTIAAVCGYALGGGLEVALACDLRVAGDNAKMGLPEVLLGLLPGAGGTQRLPRLVGPARAKALVLSGRMVDMVEAERIGLVDAVLPVDDVLAAAQAAAARYADGPASLAFAKRAIDEGLSLPLAEGLALERELFADAFATEDAGTGIASFLADGPGRARFAGR